MTECKLTVRFVSFAGFNIKGREHGVQFSIKPRYFSKGSVFFSHLNIGKGEGHTNINLKDNNAYITANFSHPYTKAGNFPITIGSAVNEGIHVELELGVEAVKALIKDLKAVLKKAGVEE